MLQTRFGDGIGWRVGATVFLVASTIVGCGDDASTSSGAGTTSTSASSGGGGEGGSSSSGGGGAGGSSSSGGGGAGGSSPYDFSCEGSPWPSTAPDPMQLGGLVYDASAYPTPVIGANVDILAIADDTALASTTSDPMGHFTFSLPTSGMALASYFKTTLADNVTSYDYPPFAFFKNDTARGLPLLSIAGRSAVASKLGVTPDPTKGIVTVFVKDCIAATVAGATVSFTPAAEAVGYVGDDLMFHIGNTTMSQGLVVALNVPAGPVEATITLGAHTWRAWTVKSYADSFVWSPRRP